MRLVPHDSRLRINRIARREMKAVGMSLPNMQPAFRSGRHLALWTAFVVCVFLSPIATSFVVPVETRFKVMSRRTGPSDWHTKIALSDHSNLDVLFVGHSQTLTNIDHDILRNDLKQRGIDLRAATVAMTWGNLDFAYYYLEELFRHRKVNIVVLPFGVRQNDPHAATKYLLSLKNVDVSLAFGHPIVAITNYAEMSLISLRLLEALVFPPGPQNLLAFQWWREVGEQLERTRGVWLAKRGYDNGKEVDSFVTRGIRQDVVGYVFVQQEGQPARVDLQFGNEPLGSLEETYLPAIKKLCEKQGTRLVLMQQPALREDEFYKASIPKEAANFKIPIMYSSIEAIFNTTDTSILKDYFYNASHMNANGAKQNAYAIAPAIASLLTNPHKE